MTDPVRGDTSLTLAASRRRFDEWAPTYGEDRRSRRIAEVQQQALEALHLEPGDRMLDVGCGTGAAVRRAATTAWSAVGVDLSAGMIARARTLADGLESVEFLVAESAHLPFEDGSFTAVLCTTSFHHYPDPEGSVREMARVLAPGGQLVIGDASADRLGARIADWFLRRFDPSHVRLHRSSEFAAFLYGAGLRDVAMRKLWGGGFAILRSRKPRPPKPVRARTPSPMLRVGLVAAVAWLGGSWPAWRSLGWYPPSSARVAFLLGWIPMLGLGLAVGAIKDVQRRRTLGALVVAMALVAPWVAAHAVPGVKQPPQYPIPGRPWLAVSAAPDGTYDLYLMKGDAGHVVAFGETPWVEDSAALSPDRRHVVFSANRYGSKDLFVTDLDAEGDPIRTRRLTSGPGDDGEAVWSPDGTKIAFTVRTGEISAVIVMDADGAHPILLTPAGNAANPAWSPDGQRIAFSARAPDDRANADIWIMRSDGSRPRDVIDATPTDWSPRWSPDGRRMAFTGGFERNWDVHIANANGSDIRNLTPGSSDTDRSYGWSPDGSKVLFLSDRSHTGGTFLYFMDPDGTDVRLALRI